MWQPIGPTVCYLPSSYGTPSVITGVLGLTEREGEGDIHHLWLREETRFLNVSQWKVTQRFPLELSLYQLLGVSGLCSLAEASPRVVDIRTGRIICFCQAR